MVVLEASDGYERPDEVWRRADWLTSAVTGRINPPGNRSATGQRRSLACLWGWRPHGVIHPSYSC